MNAKDKDGVTALMQAAQDGNAERVKALLAAGADVNAKKDDGHTSLMLVVQRRQAQPGLRQSAHRRRCGH